MAEGAPSPLELFQAGRDELLSRADSYHQAREHEKDLEGQLRGAKSQTEGARRAANEHGGELLTRIHESVNEDTDPGEYLQAILNTYHSGQPIGAEVVARLRPVREQLRRGVPVGVIGSTVGNVCLGLATGDISVRRCEEHETGFDTSSGLRLSIPLTRMNGFSTGSFSDHTRWGYRGDWPESYEVGIVQWLSKLRVASTEDEVAEINATPHAPFNQYDTVMHHERDIKSHTGFVPFIAYGETAVSAFLAAVYEGREMASYTSKPEQDDVLSAAVSLGIPPERVADIDVEAAKARLNTKFLELVSQGVRSAIYREANRRKFPNSGGFPVDWPIAAAPQVMSYARVEADALVDAMRNGIERSISELRVDDEADRPTWIGEEPEYRLLEDEAREKAFGLVAVRYGLVVEPDKLGSETLNQRLAERLEAKRQEKERHEKFEREHPWLRRTTTV